MADETFDQLLRDAEDAAFSGWDFSWLRGRMIEEARPWDYAALVRAAFPGVRSLLDIGTGGGERLGALSPLPPHTYATEGYPPNVAVARARLEPLGVRVVATASEDALPFSDGTFDLVIDRHTGVRAAEVHRVLRLGGRFITQQVGSRHNWELVAAVTGAARGLPPASSLGPFRREVEEAGFRVTESSECFPVTRVRDVGAVVSYLRAIPWMVPGFSVTTHRERLRAIHERLRGEGEVRLTSHYFLLTAVKR